jgi:2,3-bisphosphoglycerate-dependent phosphoglycerate mutase
MFRPVAFLLLVFLASCSSTHYYVVRHAEKAAPNSTMTSDVPLSEAGRRRAEALPAALKGIPVSQLWSSNTIRTRTTLEPFRKTMPNLALTVYANDSLSHYINLWKNIKGEQLLIAGHSNTVDDIINGLLGRKELSDLPDTQYGDVFIVHKKKGLFGTKTRFDKKHFGE